MVSVGSRLEQHCGLPLKPLLFLSRLILIHCWGPRIASQTTRTLISVKLGSFIEQMPQDWSTRAMVQVLKLNHDLELRFYRVFKPKIHKHLCQLNSTNQDLGIGTSLGTCLCCALILLPLAGVFNSGRRLALSDIHLLTCKPGCQLSTYISFSAK